MWNPTWQILILTAVLVANMTFYGPLHFFCTCPITTIHTHLDTRARLPFTQTADERPAAGRDVGHFGDRLHPLGTSDAHLQRRETCGKVRGRIIQTKVKGKAAEEEEKCWFITSGIHRAQLTCAHLVPARVAFIAPPFWGHRRHCGSMPRTHVLHSQFPTGTLTMP